MKSDQVGWLALKPWNNRFERIGAAPVYLATAVVAHKNERVELEMKIMKYRQAAMLATSDDETRQRIMALVAELEQKRREIDE